MTQQPLQPWMTARPGDDRMRHARQLLAVLGMCGALVLAAGCTQTCFNRECDWGSVYRNNPIPLSLEESPAAGLTPQIPDTADPATVSDPERPPRFISLQEALAMALENGNVGLQSVRNPGLVSDDLLSFSGAGVFGSDAVRVLAMDPAISQPTIEAALSRFDPLWTTSMSWNATDNPTQGFASFSNGQGAALNAALAKPLATGGTVGLTFNTNYLLLNNPPRGTFAVLNPSYTPTWTLGFEQPLLRGAGVEINQILPNFPGSRLFTGVNGRGAGEGILISRLRFDQQRAEFEKNIHFLVLNVEAAYWTLYGAYVTLYSAEQGLRQSHAAWSVGKAQFESGKIDTSQFALLRAQYEQFRADRMIALGRVLENERTLRVLLGLPVEDGQRLTPVDAPTTAPYKPSWQAALTDCLTLRPELVAAREDLQAKHLKLTAAKNGLLPDLRFQATYGGAGLGTRLDGNNQILGPNGPVTDNALRSLTSNHFNNWTMGLNLTVPLGFRAEHATTRQARLDLARTYFLLKDQERRAQVVLAKQYSQVIEKYKLIEIRRLARTALAEQLETRFRKYVAGAQGSTLEFLLDAQRQWALALSLEYQAIVDYNIALASFEFCRGSILQRNNVTIGEGQLAHCAGVRAVEHQRECTRSVVLRERSHPVIHPPLEPSELTPPLPRLSNQLAPSLPSLIEGAPPAPLDLGGTGPTSNLGLRAPPPLPVIQTAPASAATLGPVQPPTLQPPTLQPATLQPATLQPATLGAPTQTP